MNYIQLSIGTLLLLIVAACGGAGGDNGLPVSNDATIEAIDAVVGVWDLPDEGNGTPGTEAYLVIRSPNEQAEAEAIVYYVDNTSADAQSTCYLVDSRGEVTRPLDDELFLDVATFGSATIALASNETLAITIFEEGATSDISAGQIIAVTRAGITENEINEC